MGDDGFSVGGLKEGCWRKIQSQNEERDGLAIDSA